MLPSLLDVSEIQRRLLDIFPEGHPSARVLHARDGGAHSFRHAVHRRHRGEWRLDVTQTCLPDGRRPIGTTDNVDRQTYFDAVQKPGFVAPADRWSTTIRESLFAMKHYGTVS